jgi:hypothetical protein
VSRGIFDGFEGYKSANESDYVELLNSGLVAVDANVLLGLYRYNQKTRNQILDVLERVGDRLLVPHQALAEFWRNRESAISEPRAQADEAKEAVTAALATATQSVQQWANRVALGDREKKQILSPITQLGIEVSQSIDHIVASQELSGQATHTDEVVVRLERLFKGRVGEPLSSADHEKALVEAARRIEAKEPPGYKDAGKPDGRANGDYLVWVQMIGAASARDLDLLFVTNDAKEDWWRIVRGETKGPRVELVDEFLRHTGRRLSMTRPDHLLVAAEKAFNLKVAKDVVANARQVDAAPPRASVWPRSSAPLFVQVLKESAPSQYRIMAAAIVRAGFISIESATSLVDEAADPAVFLRPVRGLQKQFVEDRIIGADAPPAMRAVHRRGSSGGLIQGYRVAVDFRQSLGGPNPRVHEVASDLGIDSKIALDKLKEMGEFVKSASSSISPSVAKRLRNALVKSQDDLEDSFF